MYEIDFIPVGDGERSGDAITMRFTRPDTHQLAVVVIDAGFEASGNALVEHVLDYYETDHVDLVISTHPDLDHIGGLGAVLRRLHVARLWVHRPGLHGYSHNSGDKPAEQLVELAVAQGAEIVEPFTGVSAFGNSLVVAGPTEGYYEQLLAEQDLTAKAVAPSAAGRLAEAAKSFSRSVLDSLPTEMFFGDAGGTNPRNNSSAIIDLNIDGERFVFPSDAGVPAINGALDSLNGLGRTVIAPRLVQLPHHGSRHNLDRDTLDRLVAGATPLTRAGFTNVAPNSEMPSARINNAFMRRGYTTYETRGNGLWHYGNDTPGRLGWGPATPLPPMDESGENARDNEGPDEAAA